MTKLEIIESEVEVKEDGTTRYPAIATVHDEVDIAKTEKIASKLEEQECKNVMFESLYYCKDTFMAAKLAADASLSAVCQVLDDDCPENRGFCIIRPPGHHAHAERHHGFCFFNNVALIA